MTFNYGGNQRPQDGERTGIDHRRMDHSNPKSLEDHQPLLSGPELGLVRRLIMERQMAGRIVRITYIVGKFVFMTAAYVISAILSINGVIRIWWDGQ